MTQPPRRVVVAQLAFIGDMVFCTPLFSALRRQFPSAELVVMGRPAALEVLEDHPATLRLIPYDKDRGGGWNALRRAAARLRAFRPDVCFAVSRSIRTALLTRLSGAPTRVGFRTHGSTWAYTHAIDRADASTPFPQRPLRLLRVLGLDPDAEPLSLAVNAQRRAASRAALQAAGWNGGTLLAIAPGAHYATKRWPERHYATLLDQIEANTDWYVALYGGPAEEALMSRLAQARSRVLVRGGIGIRGVVAELPHARGFLGGDSGPAHIARALRVQALILHGPTDPRPLSDGREYPGLTLGLDCQPCSTHGAAACPLTHHRCLVELSPERVFATLTTRLSVPA